MSSLVKEIVICSFKRISKNFASIVDYIEHCLQKKLLKIPSFLFGIYNVIFIMINWWNARYILLFKNVFNVDQYAFGPVARFINLFEIREQNCCFDFVNFAFGPSGIAIITNDCLVWYKVRENILNCFIK